MFRIGIFIISGLFLSGAAEALGESRIDWQPLSLRLIDRGGVYGRMLRLPDGSLFFVCERGGTIRARQSRDVGWTWTDAQEVARWQDGSLANPELLSLPDGTLLCFHNRRPRKEAKAPYAIAVSRLEKGASAWSAPAVVYEAGSERGSGCWEPAAVQLPSGEIQLFFANESPYLKSQEQEITLMRSSDGGRVWGAPERVGFRAGHRDGMPVPLRLNDGAGIAVAIEDNGFEGAFKPVILFTTLADSWHSGTVIGQHPGRWGALTVPLPAQTYAGAPYLRQMAAGATVLSFQMSDDGEMAHSRTAVCMGDIQARGFGTITCPFPETPGASQLWASVCVKDERTVTVLATVTVNGVRGVWSVDGHLER